MEPNGAISFRHRRSPSSDRFLDVFSPPKSASARGEAASFTDDELNEDEVFWTGDFSEPNCRSTAPSSVSAGCDQNHYRHSFQQPVESGILAALAENPNRPVVYRKPTMAVTSSSRLLPAIPKPPPSEREREYSQSVPAWKFHQSAPMTIPVVPKKVRNGELAALDDGDEDDDEMLPPHEIVARGSAMLPKTTFSVLEGFGRTLKGRDLRQVRNAVMRKTVFPLPLREWMCKQKYTVHTDTRCIVRKINLVRDYSKVSDAAKRGNPGNRIIFCDHN